MATEFRLKAQRMDIPRDFIEPISVEVAPVPVVPGVFTFEVEKLLAK